MLRKGALIYSRPVILLTTKVCTSRYRVISQSYIDNYETESRN